MCGCRDGERKSTERQKTGIRIMLHFMQLAHPRHLDIYVKTPNFKEMNSISRRLSFRSLFIYKHSNIVYMYVHMLSFVFSNVYFFYIHVCIVLTF